MPGLGSHCFCTTSVSINPVERPPLFCVYELAFTKEERSLLLCAFALSRCEISNSYCGPWVIICCNPHAIGCSPCYRLAGVSSSLSLRAFFHLRLHWAFAGNGISLQCSLFHSGGSLYVYNLTILAQVLLKSLCLRITHAADDPDVYLGNFPLRGDISKRQ